MKKVIIEVRKGVAEVVKCPRGVEVKIIDHDGNDDDPEAMTCRTCKKKDCDSLYGGQCFHCDTKPKKQQTKKKGT